MTDLSIHGRKVTTVFQLLGEDENDISYSVAWALSRCTKFLDLFLKKITGHKEKVGNILIRLQHYENKRGFTDIEVESAGRIFVMIEAKKGWNLPTSKQITKYANRSSFKNSCAPFKAIVALSECSKEYAQQNLEVHEIDSIPVIPMSWKNIYWLATKAQSKGTHAEKRLLTELIVYFKELMNMQNLDSNRVYVVSLAKGKPKGWGISWINIVEKKRRYFHPMGIKGWPKEPPNYIAFRYDGRLQSIHHIEGYEIFKDPHQHFPEIPSVEWDTMFLYKLGKGFWPSKEIKTGKIYPNGRVWCMLDTLFISDTISDARDLSDKRKNQAL